MRRNWRNSAANRKQFGNGNGHRFANHWEFVRYAQEQGLNLDFTTPPRRPNRESERPTK